MGEPVLRGLLVLALLNPVTLGAAPDGAAETNLESVQVVNLLAVGADAQGRVAAWDWDTGRISVWKGDGALLTECVARDPRLGVSPSRVAVRGDRAFLRFYDPPAASSRGDERGAVLDLGRCKVLKDFGIPGALMAVAPSADGWLLVVNEQLPANDGFAFIEMDDDGKVVRRFDLLRHLRQRVDKPELADLYGAFSGRLFASAKEVWFLPHSMYELWRPAQRGLPLREVVPPECLAVKGRRVTGEELRKFFEEVLLKDVPEEVRAQSMASTRRDGFSYASTSVATFRRTTAVALRDPKLPKGDRIDIWDMTSEAVVAIGQLPEGAHLVAIEEQYAWLLTTDRRFVRWPLPEHAEPLADPCAVYRSLIEASQVTGSPAATPAPQPSPQPTAGSKGTEERRKDDPSGTLR